MQITPQLHISNTELHHLDEQIIANIKSYEPSQALAKKTADIATTAFYAIGILNAVYFASPAVPLIVDVIGEIISDKLLGFHTIYIGGTAPSVSLGMRVGRAVYNMRALSVVALINAVIAGLALCAYAVGSYACSSINKRVKHYEELQKLIAKKETIPESYHAEIEKMISKYRENKKSAPENEELKAINNATLPALSDVQKNELPEEQAIHEIVPGLFLGGSDYQAKKVHRCGKDSETVAYDQIISVTHDMKEEGFKPDPKAAVYKFPGDSARTPVDVTLESLKSAEQSHLKEAIRLIHKNLSDRKNVFVHCRQGVDRSATVVIAYIMSAYDISFEKALTFMRSKRWIAEPGESYLDFLKNEFKPVKLT